MAIVQNVVLTIGDDPAPSPVLTVGGNAVSNDYRNVNVKADLKFTPQEIGLTYRLYATLFASDRQRDDSDETGSFMPFFTEDSNIENLSEIADNNKFSISHRAYKNILVSDLNMPVDINKSVAVKKLNEDPTEIILAPWGFSLKREDELFARVSLSAVSESEPVKKLL